MIRKILAIMVVLQAAFLVACGTLPYADDLHFLVSAQAGSTEFPVYVNGHLCVDMEGKPGLCAKRVSTKESINLHFDPQDYPMLLSLVCSDGVTGIAPQNIPAKQPFTYTIKPEQFPMVQFTCNGKVNPQDRNEPIAAAFQIRFVVYDAAYTAREEMHVESYNGDSYLVLGQFARDAWVYDDGKWSRHSKDTEVLLEGDPAQVKAYSGSYLMRFNYYGMTASDGGVTR